MNKGVFTTKNIWTGTMLGGPIAGGYYLYKNFKIFGNTKKAILSIIISIAFTILLLSLIKFIPANVPNLLIPVIYTVIFYIIAKIFQEDAIIEYLEKEQIKAGWGKTILVAIICVIITIGLYFISFVPMFIKYSRVKNITNNISHVPELDNNTMNKEYGIQKIYYNKELEEADIDKTAQILIDTGIFNDKIVVFVYINNENSIFTIYFNKNLLVPGITDVYDKIRNEFPDKKIKIKFFDKTLNDSGAEIYNENYK
jgi:hypothetical protein